MWIVVALLIALVALVGIVLALVPPDNPHDAWKKTVILGVPKRGAK